jgi:hypothetical protein
VEQKPQKASNLIEKNCFTSVNIWLTTEDIVSKYGRLIKSRDGKREPNIEGQIEFQKKVEDYEVSEGRIKPTTCVSMLPPIKLFCEMNDILELENN